MATLNYLSHEDETSIMLRKVPSFDNPEGKEEIGRMVSLADLTRQGFINGDLSTLMSPRTVLTWAENVGIFGDREMAFRLSFLNKCDESERAIIAEYYQRCFGVELPARFLKLQSAVPGAE
jgi:cobaltochelatase CobS